jgi:uncharacterized protein YndB with AHSA1/START domain
MVATNSAPFVISRVVNAPRERVWKAWTERTSGDAAGLDRNPGPVRRIPGDGLSHAVKPNERTVLITRIVDASREQVFP